MSELEPPSAALVFLHGSGDNGDGVAYWLEDTSNGAFQQRLQSSGIRVLYPDAPVIPYTLSGGCPQAVWFDRKAMAYEAPEDAAGMARSVEQVDTEIDKLVEAGIPLQHIGVAGMSMGGCLALHVAYGSGRHSGQLGAAASLSSFLPLDSRLYAVADQRFQETGAKSMTPLFMAHGASDPMVSSGWAKKTRDRLEAVGIMVPPEVITFPDLGHDMCSDEIRQLTDFLVDKLGARP
eukprot:CAMPEP_0172719102 /NCGR_PEP_ID=MMETSP1074-20121228/75313_1 /TAXON_ID=2916 /ORGANISM="Ceratium fusus, Strain PA161109" /LENGTH=234 /DNA_ID=CAMNT_0013544421 /DNA_START=50 /DNA_END=754 /DNA_ORIENTATION=-